MMTTAMATWVATRTGSLPAAACRREIGNQVRALLLIPQADENRGHPGHKIPGRHEKSIETGFGPYPIVPARQRLWPLEAGKFRYVRALPSRHARTILAAEPRLAQHRGIASMAVPDRHLPSFHCASRAGEAPRL